MAEEKAKPITIKEFKMWLQGVEDMQATGWTPDARQWERIRAKIDLIDDTTVQPTYTPTNFPAGMEAVFPPMNPNPPAAGGGSAVAVPSGLNVPSQPVRPARATTTPSGLPVSLATGGNPAPVKTPDIDTSNGKPYNSKFA